MSDLMLHGVLNMPLPDDPSKIDLVTWVQFKDRATQASSRIEELEERLKAATDDATEAEAYAGELEAKLEKAVEALGEAIYLLDPDEEDIAKETGLYRIVTTYAELTGGKDD